MLRWPKSAKRAIAYLFRPIQDVDIYVEDTGDEAFYSELFKRIGPENIRISRVISAGGRESILRLARTHNFTERPACFIIDGDFSWVRGDPPPSQPGLIRLNAYCIENLLIGEHAVTQILAEEEAVAQEEAARRIGFSPWIESIRESLVRLFVYFAVLNLIDPAEPTTSLGVGSIIAARKGKPAAIDPSRLMRLTADVRKKDCKSRW